MSLAATACGGDGDDGGGGDESGAPEEEQTLTVAIPTLGAMDWGPETSYSDNEKFLMLMGNNLVTINESGEFVPELATEWELSEDGLTWTFKLREDVPFHDGWGTMTARDVQFTWDAYTNDNSIHVFRDLYRQAVGGDMANFEIVNDFEFTLTAEEPVPHLLAAVCSCFPGPTIFSADYYEEEGEAALQHPVLTGPFEYVSHRDGEELVMERFDDYWGEPATASQVVLKEIPDGAARLSQVLGGEVDMAQLDANLASEVQANPDLSIANIPYITNAWIMLGGSYYGHEALDVDSPWIQADNPDQGRAIREAMSLAIDRELIIEEILFGFAEPTYGPIVQYPQVPALTDPSWELPEYDPDRARELLAEGGYPDGFEVELPLFGSDIDTVAIGEALAGMWEEIGLTVNRAPTEERELEEAETNHQTQGMAWIQLTAFSPEPATVLSTYVMASDRVHFYHPTLEEHVPLISEEPDPEARFAHARDMIQALRDDTTVIPLFTGDMLFVTGPRVDAWTPYTVNTVNSLETVTFR